MAKPITIPNTFASATSAIPLAQLDQDFSTLANATNDLATYSNYVADTGAADAYIANFPANTNTSSLTAGLTVQFKAANANTGASTLNVQVNGASIGTAAIRYANGSALAAGAIAAGAMVSVMYDGTNFQLINDPAGQSGGDVTGPASATDNAIARFDGASGKLIQNSVVTIADTTGDMSGIGNLTINGTTVTCSNGLNFDSNTLVIDAANNNVGIGTSSPTQKLQVTGTDNSGLIGVKAQNNNGSLGIAGIEFSSDSTYTKAAIGLLRQSVNGRGRLVFYNDSNDDAANWSTADEKMCISEAGNVGIGTSSPSASYRLSVVGGGIYTNGASSDFGSGLYPVIRINPSGNNAIFGISLDGSQGGTYNGRDWRIEQGRNAVGNFNITEIGGSNPVRFSINGNGNIGLTNANASADGVGITFPATQSASSDANTLDDYEEGTWTPAWTSGVTTPGYSDTSGTYVKIGRLVTFTARIQTTSGTANANQLVIGGLPFNYDATTQQGGAFFNYQGAFLTNNELTMHVATGGLLFYSTDGTSLLGTEAGNIAATIHINGFYYTTT